MKMTTTGFIESGGAIAFEAEHATRNNSVEGMFWKVLPGLGRTLSGVTPWPRLGNNDNNFTAGAGPSLYAPTAFLAPYVRLTA